MSDLPRMGYLHCRACARRTRIQNALKLVFGVIIACLIVYLLSLLPHPILGSTMMPRAWLPSIAQGRVVLSATGIATPESP